MARILQNLLHEFRSVALAECLRQLRIGLLEGGFNLIATLPADTFLRERLAQLQPDMIIFIFDAESDARDSLEHVVMATRDERRPIMMFTNDDDTRHVRDAVAAGVSAYIVICWAEPPTPKWCSAQLRCASRNGSN